MTSSILDVVIIGAGPFGLSIAAHLRHTGTTFRIFGKPMDSWIAHMPSGMKLKSEGFASDLYDPGAEYTLKHFCAEQGIEYADSGVAVTLETFTAYGLAFQKRMVPELEDKLVSSVEQTSDGFTLQLEDGETVNARRVVLAVGITHFAYVPEEWAQLPPDLLSHASRHRDLEVFRGRKVVVIGGGASAMDTAALLHEGGADVTMVSRRSELKFPPKPTNRRRSLWQRIRHPESGLGDGLRRRFLANSPLSFHYLPEKFRLWTVRRALGPSGGWFSRDMVMGRFPLLLEHTPIRLASRNGKVQISLRAADGSEREIEAEHVIAATGYKVDMARLTFLSQSIRQALKLAGGSPVLSSHFESTVPGLYFAGLSAANSFGSVMRFAFGAGFAARQIARSVSRYPSRHRSVSAARLVTDPERRA